MVGLVAALGEKRALIAGHDFGATVAWHSALLRPDMFPAVAALSVPYRQRGPVPPLRALRQAGLYTYYWLYYQDPGVAEAEYDRDPRATLRRTLYTFSGDAPHSDVNRRILAPGKGALDSTLDPEHLPGWLSDADLDYMASVLARNGFRNPINYYRNIDKNWELLAPWAGAAIRQPALFIAGSEDHVIRGPTGKAQLDAMATTVPGLKRQLIIDGAGHYIQQERASPVTAALMEFLHSVS
jgi:pimeloyl-ACP methyl ester carboxylesterase